VPFGLQKDPLSSSSTWVLWQTEVPLRSAYLAPAAGSELGIRCSTRLLCASEGRLQALVPETLTAGGRGRAPRRADALPAHVALWLEV